MFTVSLASGGSLKVSDATLGPGGVLIVITTDKRSGKQIETLYSPTQWRSVSHEVE